MTTPEFQHPDTRLRLEATKDYFDTMIRGASLLLVAHGAALAGCIVFFKEPHTPPIFGGLELFVFLFGTGFIFAASGYGMMAVLRMSAVSALFDNPLLRPWIAKLAGQASWWFLLFSMLQLIAAVWGMIFTAFGPK